MGSLAHSAPQSIFGASVFQDVLFAFRCTSCTWLHTNARECAHVMPISLLLPCQRHYKQLLHLRNMFLKQPPVPARKEIRLVWQDLIAIKPCGPIFVDFQVFIFNLWWFHYFAWDLCQAYWLRTTHVILLPLLEYQPTITAMSYKINTGVQDICSFRMLKYKVRDMLMIKCSDLTDVS